MFISIMDFSSVSQVRPKISQCVGLNQHCENADYEFSWIWNDAFLNRLYRKSSQRLSGREIIKPLWSA